MRQEATTPQMSPENRQSGRDLSHPANYCPTVQMSREGLEPSTSGLTYRTGFRPPDRCGLDFTISPGGAGREPLVKSLRIPAARAAGLSC